MSLKNNSNDVKISAILTENSLFNFIKTFLPKTEYIRHKNKVKKIIKPPISISTQKQAEFLENTPLNLLDWKRQNIHNYITSLIRIVDFKSAENLKKINFFSTAILAPLLNTSLEP